MNVMRNTFRLVRKIEPKYAGRSTVTQHGANKAAMPAINAAMSDVLIIVSIAIRPHIRRFGRMKVFGFVMAQRQWRSLVIRHSY